MIEHHVYKINCFCPPLCYVVKEISIMLREEWNSREFQKFSLMNTQEFHLFEQQTFLITSFDGIYVENIDFNGTISNFPKLPHTQWMEIK